jgi:hypothetical protein
VAAVAVLSVGTAMSCGGGRTGADVAQPPKSSATAGRATTIAPTTAAPTTAAPATTRPLPATTKAPPPVVPGAGIAVGDSVLEDVQLYASTTLASHNIAINAAVGRQWAVGVSILSSLRTRGKLPPVVIVGLGSNGRVTDTQFDQMMQACAGAKRVVFMTVTGPLIGNNPVITTGVARYPTAALADWNTLAAAHPDWFAPDHVHIGPAGATALGNLLASMS